MGLNHFWKNNMVLLNSIQVVLHFCIMNIPYLKERPLMTSDVFWPFFTYLPTLSYFILYKSPIFGGAHFRGYLGPPLPTLILDVINGRSLIKYLVNTAPSENIQSYCGYLVDVHSHI